jgi:cytochrome c oxidase subunit 5a
LRKGINDLQGYDNFPEPRIVASALEACRRLNEHSVAVRLLEALKVMLKENDRLVLCI